MDFIFASENLIFNIALTAMIAIALIEGVGNLIGVAVGSFIDSVIPEFDIETDIDTGIVSATPFTNFLGWLHIGQVPFLILVIVFLASFGILGLITQRIILNATGGLWSGAMLSLPVFLASLPCVSVFGGLLGRLFPKEESEAVSEASFIGSSGVITLGSATKGKPTEARLTDEYGQDHYILVEPEDIQKTLSHQDEIVIVNRKGNIYLAAAKNK